MWNWEKIRRWIEMLKIPLLRNTLQNKIKDIIFFLFRKKTIKHTYINGYAILVITNEGPGWSTYYLKRYDSKETDFIKRIVQKNWTCFDIGANVGYYSLLFASLAKDGIVHSFEPLPLHYHLLNVNIFLNNFTNIIVNHCALGKQAGVSDFAVSKRGDVSSFVYTKVSPLEKIIQVSVRTLDDYVEEKGVERIDLLKLDVEGAEKLVLEGAGGTLSKKELQPNILLVELYNSYLIKYDTSIDEIVSFLHTLGYGAFIISKQHLVPFTFKDYNLRSNVFFIKKESICGGENKWGIG